LLSDKEYLSNTTSSYFSGFWKTEDAIPSVHSPDGLQLPGITEESRRTTAKLILKNHVSYHCFFNDKGFHNHLIHHVLAAFSLGAPPKRLEEFTNYTQKINYPSEILFLRKSRKKIGQNSSENENITPIIFAFFLKRFARKEPAQPWLLTPSTLPKTQARTILPAS